jgi:DNA-binding NtrC family response regulator
MKSNSRLSIFLVDEDPFFLSACEQYLRKQGYENITKFRSSIHFLKNLCKNPDLILLDNCLDSLNGACELRKINQFNPDALVVFISGKENIDVAVDAFKKGLFNHQAKNENCGEKMQPVPAKAAIKEIFYNNKKNVVNLALPLVGIAALILFILLIFAK